MKGVIVKTNKKPMLSDIGQIPEWEVEYKNKLPHAGVSKLGTGPGVSRPLFETKRIPLHPEDVYNSDGSLFAEEGKEIEFVIDYHTPCGMMYGQEQYSSILQQAYGEGAKILKHEETWDDIRDKLLSDGGFGDASTNESLIWVIEEFKKRNYEVPKIKLK